MNNEIDIAIKLAKIEDMIEHFTDTLKELKEKGHPDCLVRDSKINSLTKSHDSIMSRINYLEGCTIGVTKDISSLDSTINSFKGTVVKFFLGIITLIAGSAAGVFLKLIT